MPNSETENLQPTDPRNPMATSRDDDEAQEGDVSPVTDQDMPDDAETDDTDADSDETEGEEAEGEVEEGSGAHV